MGQKSKKNASSSSGVLSRNSSVSAPFGITSFSTKLPLTLSPSSLWRSIISERSQLELCRDYLHDPEALQICWKELGHNSNWKRAVRCTIQMQTIQALLRARVFLADGTPIDLPTHRKQREAMVKVVVRYVDTELSSASLKSVYDSDCEISVENEDCLHAAIKLLDANFKSPLCLILASMSHPGGGYRRGAAAQEESIARRTNLWELLEDPYNLHPERDWSYPLPEFGGVYCPKVIVLREAESEGYRFIQAREISTLNAAAYASPPLEEITRANGQIELRIANNLVPLYRRKIRAILTIAAAHNHDALVLSAFGCGVYGTPPMHMAELFKEELRPYKRCFRKVIFAILDDANAFKEHNPDGNFEPFRAAFNDE